MIRVLLVVLVLAASVSIAGFWYGTMNKEVALPKVANVETPTSSQSSKLATLNTCTNGNKKFTISYPLNWSVNTLGEACHFFAPQTGIVSEKNTVITLDSTLTKKAFDELKTSLKTSNEERLVLSTLPISNGALSITKVETEGTGIGAVPKGSRSMFYLIDDANNPVILSLNETALGNKQNEYLKVLDDMVVSFRYQ